MSLRKVAGSALAVCCLLGMTACADEGYDADPVAFSQDRGAEDEIPEDVAASLEDSQGSDEFPTLDATTSRFIGEWGDASFYLAESSEEDGLCVLIYGDTGDWASSCSGSERYGFSATLGGVAEVQVIASGTDIESEWELLDENVAVRAPA